MMIKNGEIMNIKGKNEVENGMNKELGLWYVLLMKCMMFGEGIKRLMEECNWDKKKVFEEVLDLE